MAKQTPRASELMRLLIAELQAGYDASERAPSADPCVVRGPGDVANIMFPLYVASLQEELWVVLLNTRNHVVGQHMIYRGSVDSCSVRLAEVFRPAIVDGVPAVVLCHNHPSGDTGPSTPDLTLTKMAIDAGTLLGIEVLDHIIIGRGDYTSLKERCLGGF